MSPRMKPRVTRHKGEIPRWTVPLHLRGLACQVCGYFFQDGESHGELNFLTGEVECKTRVLRVTNRPSTALVRWDS